jgi:putative membrane protein
MSAKDMQFMVEADKGNLGEIEMGNYAITHGSSARVKDFGKRLVQDHSQANQRLMKIASKYGVKLPRTTDAEHQKAMKRIFALSGQKFDQAWTGYMVEDHRNDLKAYQAEAKSTSNADLKAYATDGAKIISAHLKMAEQTLRAVGAKNAGNSAAGTTKSPDSATVHPARPASSPTTGGGKTTHGKQ